MEKLVKIVTGIIIITVVITNVLLNSDTNVNQEKNKIDDIITKAKIKPVMEYIENNKKDLILYEGATYCINGFDVSTNEFIEDYIVEVVYSNKEFKYRINNNCKEK